MLHFMRTRINNLFACLLKLHAMPTCNLMWSYNGKNARTHFQVEGGSVTPDMLQEGLVRDHTADGSYEIKTAKCNISRTKPESVPWARATVLAISSFGFVVILRMSN
jgi:hypothetical protein